MKESPIPPTPTSSSASAQAGIAAPVQMRRLPSRISLPLLRQSVNTGATGESLGRFLWAKTLTPFLDPQSESHWRCWPQTVSRHIFNKMTASANAGHFALHSWVQPGSVGGTCRWHRRHPFAQPANRWRFQIQSTERRTGRHRCHRLDSKPRERVAARRSKGRSAY